MPRACDILSVEYYDSSDRMVDRWSQPIARSINVPRVLADPQRGFAYARVKLFNGQKGTVRLHHKPRHV